MKSSQLERIRKIISGAFKQPLILPEYPKKQLLILVLSTILSLLPLLAYLSIVVAGAVYSVVFAIEHLPYVSGEAGVLSLLFYLILLLMFTSVLVFLVRPLFTMQMKKKEALVLSKKSEPLLYQVTSELSKSLGCPSVEHVYVTDEVVVDLYYQSFNDFRGNRLTLRLGLPLVSTLELREFMGLLVHEYAHLANSKIRLSYFTIRALRAWLYSVTQGQDQWSEKLLDLAEQNIYWKVALFPVYASIVFVNYFFQMFSGVVELITAPALEQIAFYSDHVQIELVGSDKFADDLKHLVSIDQAYHAAIETILSGDLVPQNMSSLIVANHSRDKNKAFDQTIEMARSDDFNSWHMLPSAYSRIDQVDQWQATAKVVLTSRFEELFVDPELVGQKVSANFYKRHDIGAPTKQKVVNHNIPIEMSKPLKILQRFTSGLFRRDIVWEFPEAGKFNHLPDEKVLPFLNKVIVSIRHNIPGFSQYVESVDDYKKLVKRYHYYQWLMKDGNKNRPSIEKIEQVKFDIKTFESKHKKTMEMYKKFNGVRVSAATALGKSSKAFGSASKLIFMLSRLGELEHRVNEAKIKSSTIDSLLKQRDSGGGLHDKTLTRLTKMVLKTASDMESALQTLPDVLIKEYVDINLESGKLTPEDLKQGVFEQSVIGRFYELVRYYEAYNVAISAKLAQFVEAVEKTRNIEPVVKLSLKNPS